MKKDHITKLEGEQTFHDNLFKKVEKYSEFLVTKHEKVQEYWNSGKDNLERQRKLRQERNRKRLNNQFEQQKCVMTFLLLNLSLD